MGDGGGEWGIQLLLMRLRTFGRRSGGGSEGNSETGQIPSVSNMIETTEANSAPGRRSGAGSVPSMRDMIEASEEEAFETESEEDVFSDISENKLGADG